MENRLIKYASIFLTLFVFLYLFFAFLSPMLMKYGNYDLGVKIQKIYERFCHQRVERALFLFSERSLFSTYNDDIFKDEREDDRYTYLPDWLAKILEKNYDGHGKWGNEEMGYKVAICIRDIALYGSFLIVSVILQVLYYLFKFSKKISLRTLMIMLSPILLDVFIQILIDIFSLIPTTHWFYDNWVRRILTGLIAGSSIAIYLFGELLTIGHEKEKI